MPKKTRPKMTREDILNQLGDQALAIQANIDFDMNKKIFEMKWEIGKLIEENKKNVPIKVLVKHFSDVLNSNERTIYRRLVIYKEYQEDTFEEAYDTYLADKSTDSTVSDEDCECTPQPVCTKCRKHVDNYKCVKVGE